jgi:hypothetical protein
MNVLEANPHNLPPSVGREQTFETPHYKKSSTEKQEELESLFALQEEFNQALGLKFDPEDMLKRSHNPVIDRWHVKRYRDEGNLEALEAHRLSMRENMRTNLMERLHTVESYGEYKINGNELVSKDFPGKSFYEILERGVEYRKKLGSPEQEREGELGELAGWNKINTVMTTPDTPVGSTIYSFSPRGLAEGTVYDGWFVDSLTLRENFKKEKYVERIRTGVNWDYSGYAEAALKLDSHYFDNYDGRPVDAWFLANSIIGDIELDKKGFSVIDTDRILNNYKLRRYIQNYENQIFNENINWLETAIAFNAILNYLDDLKNGKNDMYIQEVYEDEKSFIRGVQVLGRRQVQIVGGGGCPPNKGVDLGGVFGSSGISTGIDILSNSVGKFGVEGLLEEGGCNCENKSDNHYHCPKCDEKYADETKLEPEDRTKKCGCGFKFGC